MTMKPTVNLNPEAVAIARQIHDVANNFHVERKRIHEKANEDCEKLGADRQAVMGAMFDQLFIAQGLPLSLKDQYSLDMSYAADHGLAFLRPIEFDQPQGSFDFGEMLRNQQTQH